MSPETDEREPDETELKLMSESTNRDAEKKLNVKPQRLLQKHSSFLLSHELKVVVRGWQQSA